MQLSALISILSLAACTIAAPQGEVANLEKRDYRLDIIIMANQKRQAAGCKPLSLDAALHRAAQVQADDMARFQYTGHVSHNGRTMGDRIRKEGYKFGMIGENVASGSPSMTPKSAIEGWMKSAGHKANILNCRYQNSGVGYGRGKDSKGRTVDCKFPSITKNSSACNLLTTLQTTSRTLVPTKHFINTLPQPFLATLHR